MANKDFSTPGPKPIQAPAPVIAPVPTPVPVVPKVMNTKAAEDKSQAIMGFMKKYPTKSVKAQAKGEASDFLEIILENGMIIRVNGTFVLNF